MTPSLRARYQRRATELRLTLDEYLVILALEQAKSDAIAELRWSHTAQFKAIARHAARNGRRFEIYQ